MLRIKKNILLILATVCILLMQTFTALSQTIKFEVSAPSVVEAGEVFKVTYKINSASIRGGFEIPKIPGLEIVSGPQRGQSSQVSIINGKTTQSYEITETYLMQANKPGSVMLPVATAIVNGEIYTTKSKKIEVVGSAQEKQTKQQAQQDKETEQALEDVFAKIYVEKQKVYVGEPIYISIKLYTKYQISINDHKFPSFDGFFKQDLESPQSLSYETEKINGKEYYSVLFKKMVVYPQKSGTLEITPFVVDLNASIPAGRDFWGVRYNTQNKVVKTKPIKITVLPLPAGKPESFSGAVGQFNVSAKTDVTDIKQNEAFTYTITINGLGNLSLIQAQTIEFPSDFEVYDPKLIEKFEPTARGDNGSKTFEYLIIPRQEGKFTIPEFKFTYFDPQSKTYKTITKDAILITVNKGDGSTNNSANFGVNKKDVTYANSDIRYLKTNAEELQTHSEFFFNTVLYYIILILILLGLLAYIFITQHKQKSISNQSEYKFKTANKESKKRLKLAKELLQKNENTAYFNEVSRALWGYISDKYFIPLSELSKDSIQLFLEEKQVSEDIIQEFKDIIQKCEMAQYAGLSVEGKENLYLRAEKIIQFFEVSIK